MKSEDCIQPYHANPHYWQYKDAVQCETVLNKGEKT